MLAEDASIITDLGMDQLNMVLTSLNLKTPDRITFPATRYEDGSYEFDVPKAPLVAGDYNIQFFFSSAGQQVLNSEVLKFSVESDKPSRFMPTNPPNPNSRINVSNTSASNSRIIVRGLKFLLMDQHYNAIKVTSKKSREFDGVLSVDIVGRIGGGGNKAPSSQDKLRYGYFGITPSQQLGNLKREVQLLKSLKASCSLRKNAEAAVQPNEIVLRQALVSLEADHQALKKLLGEIEEKIRKLSQTRGLMQKFYCKRLK